MDEILSGLIEESDRRMVELMADYDPVTGEGAPGERVELRIPDFAIPVQRVPAAMARNRLVRSVVECGGIQAFLDSHEFEDGRRRSFRAVERELRRIRHRHDFCFWAYFQCHILDKRGRGLVRLKLNHAQIETLLVCERLRLSDRPINIIICKARQWGGSTFSIFYQTWLALMWRPTHAFSVCAQTKGVATSITNMLGTAFERYRPWDVGLPDDERLRLSKVPESSEYILRDSRGNQVRHNKIRIGSIEAPDNLRGLPGSGAHFSEVGVWPDSPERRPEDLIKSITGGILPLPYTMQVIESTPKGAGNYFHRAYLEAKSGKSGFTPIYIAWFKIPHDTLPIDDRRAFAEWLWTHREDAEPNGKWRDPGAYYWYLWTLGATLEGINWYRYKSLEYNDHADMASEASSDDVEAFQYSGSKVFDIYAVEAMRRDCRPPAARGVLVADAAKGEGAGRNVRFVEGRNGELRVWDFPDREAPLSNRYLVSVDVGGRSPKADWSVARVFDRYPMTMGGRPELVASMRYHTDFDYLAYDVMRLARWYNDALLVIESNTLETRDRERDTDGNMTEYILDTIGDMYDNLYARSSGADDINDPKPTKWGWHTNSANKPTIIGNLIEAVRDRLWVEREEVCCDELELYEKDSKGRFSAPPGLGNHDDVLMATAIAMWICYHDMDRPAWREGRARERLDTDPRATAII